MQEFTLNIPATSIMVASRDVQVEIEVAKIPHDVLRQVMWHGIKQKVADAASGVVGQLWLEVKGKDAPKPSRDQLAAFAEAHDKAVKDATLAAMQKAADALLAGKWLVREGTGTSSKYTDEQSLALDLAKAALTIVFEKGLAIASPGTKATASAFVALGPKIAAFFKSNEKRPTWDDSAVMDYITRQKEADKRDFLAEAREELAKRAAANAGLADTALDDILGDL